MESSITSLSEAMPQVQGKGFGVRAGAYVIDVIVICIVTLAVSLIVGMLLGIILVLVGREISSLGESSRGLDLLLGLVSSTLYFVFFEWLHGATPGKLTLGMRVVMADGRPCTFGAAFVRALLRYIDSLFFGIPAYANMKEPLLQRIGDKAAKTIVVGAKDPFMQRASEWWWFLVAASIYVGVVIVTSLIQTVVMLR